MRRRNQAHGLGADLLQGLDGVFQTAWFVCHDPCIFLRGGAK
jgi:hypothetical protein